MNLIATGMERPAGSTFQPGMSVENWPAPEERPNWVYYDEPQRRLSWWVWVMFAVLAAIVLGLIYYFMQDHERVPRAPVTQPPVAAAKPPAQKPEIRYPIPQVEGETEPDRPLPPLEQSDEPLGERLAALLGNQAFDDFITPKEIVRRVVVTVDNLPRKVAPMRARAVKPVQGQFAPGAQNAARYDAQVKLFESLDAKALVRIYVRFYPLLQSTYSEVGQPDAYFNDRVVEAIDDMLAAPDLKEAPQLVQPKVLYQYAEPELESRSAGQKILMRIGPAHEAKVKAKLREIRSAVTATGLSGIPTKQ
jgi:hypothetical protein